MPDTHACPYPRCVRRIPRHIFACRAHWYLLPQPLRRAIREGYRGHGGDHLEAMGAAIDWYREHDDELRGLREV